MEIMKFKDILNTIIKAAKIKETVGIYYPETRQTKEGWREIEPYSIATDVPPEGEHLDIEKEIIKPGHILNAYTVDSNDKEIDSFILGKIKKATRTGNKFEPRRKWEIKI